MKHNKLSLKLIKQKSERASFIVAYGFGHFTFMRNELLCLGKQIRKADNLTKKYREQLNKVIAEI